MLTDLFASTVREALGLKSIASNAYDYALVHDRSDSITGQTRLEATPHILDKTKYSLSEVVTSTSRHRLTALDMKAAYLHSTKTYRTPIKDDNGKPYSLTHDEALQKIAEFEQKMDKHCESKNFPTMRKTRPQPA